MLNIVMFGPPGSGKGTQSQKLIEKYNLVHISTGEILRKEIAEKTPFGIEAQKFIDDGNYVTDEMAIEIILNVISKNKNSNGFVFDGFPRTIAQADTLKKILSDLNSDVSLMISFDVDEEILINRLQLRSDISCRPDDRSRDIIKKRLELYKHKTELVKKYYSQLSKYQSINGEGEIDKIFSDICKLIDTLN